MADLMAFNSDGSVELAKKAQALIKRAKKLDLQKKKLDIEMEAFKESLLQAMEGNEIWKIETEDFTATRIAAGTRKTVDTQALKAQGLYESFLKETPTKASVRVSFKEEAAA